MAAQEEAAMGSGDEHRLREIVAQLTTEAGLRPRGTRGALRRSSPGGPGGDRRRWRGHAGRGRRVSRSISERLDAIGDDDPAGSAPYTLEVTSPGIGRPLTLPRHFRRARTRLVALVTTDGRRSPGMWPAPPMTRCSWCCPDARASPRSRCLRRHRPREGGGRVQPTVRRAPVTGSASRRRRNPTRTSPTRSSCPRTTTPTVTETRQPAPKQTTPTPMTTRQQRGRAQHDER